MRDPARDIRRVHLQRLRSELDRRIAAGRLKQAVDAHAQARRLMTQLTRLREAYVVQQSDAALSAQAFAGIRRKLGELSSALAAQEARLGGLEEEQRRWEAEVLTLTRKQETLQAREEDLRRAHQASREQTSSPPRLPRRLFEDK